MKQSESRRMSQAVVIVHSVTVACPFCGRYVSQGCAIDPDDGPALHTDEHHVRTGGLQCPTCWQLFDVPDLAIAFRRIHPRKR
jgi:hypothetical protein